jgi:hypothetical protein
MKKLIFFIGRSKSWKTKLEELHVLIQCEDYENRALVKLERAKEEISKLLQPAVNILIKVRSF